MEDSRFNCMWKFNSHLETGHTIIKNGACLSKWEVPHPLVELRSTGSRKKHNFYEDETSSTKFFVFLSSLSVELRILF